MSIGFKACNNDGIVQFKWGSLLMRVFKITFFRVLLISLVLVVACPWTSYGKSIKNILMIQSLWLPFNNISLEHEMSMGESVSIAWRTNITNFYTCEHISQIGFGSGISLRHYPGEKAPKGFYYGPRLDVFRMGNSVIGLYHLELGYKAIVSNSFVFAPFVEMGGVSSNTDLELGGLVFLLSVGLYLGYAF